MATQSFAQIGNVFNDATTKLVGGVWNTVNSGGNAASIQNDLQSVQSNLQQLIQQNADQFQGATGIHAQEIVNQLNLEIANVQQAAAGTNAFAPKEINDIQRDIIDIVQGDANLLAMATQGGANGFAPVPALLNQPTPFQDNAAQTAFISQFVADSTNLGQQAVALAGSTDTAAIGKLVGQIQAYEANLNTFDANQGGIFAARFANELDVNGNAGTIANALIGALQSGNVDLVKAAATALADNAADVNGNNHALGAPPSPTPVAPADQPHNNLADIGAIFDDATTMMIGGISPATNKAPVIADLKAVQTDLHDLIAAHPDLFQGATGIHAQEIVHQLSLEIQATNNIGVDPTAPKYVNDIQRDIIDIVQADPNLQNMATQGGASGFHALPDLLAAPTPFKDSPDQAAFLTKWIADSSSLGAQAVSLAEQGGNRHDVNQLIHEIQTFATNANNFTFAQGGVFSARFNNELATNGNNGVVAKDLIHGLQTHNVAEVQAAATALADNAADVAGNNGLVVPDNAAPAAAVSSGPPTPVVQSSAPPALESVATTTSGPTTNNGAPPSAAPEATLTNSAQGPATPTHHVEETHLDFAHAHIAQFSHVWGHS